MQNKFINNIANSVKLIIIVILIMSIFIAKSLFLLLFLLTLEFIILILIDKNVNVYVEFIKKIKMLLLFIFIVYIIIYRDLLYSFIFLYKLVCSSILIKVIIIKMNFKDLNNGIYTILFPLKLFTFNIKKISYNITLTMYFLKFLISSKMEIKQLQLMKNKTIHNIRNFFMPRLMISINNMKNIENSLKLNYFELKADKLNFKSILLLIIFMCLFSVVVFKEVIL